MKHYPSFFLAILILSFLPAINSALVAVDPARIAFKEIASGLAKPVFITNAGDGSSRLFIVEQGGRIRIRKNGTLLSAAFLDIHSIIKSTGNEQGLLALAFDPDYSTNGNFYVAYTAARSGDADGSNLVLKKFSVSANDPDVANPASGVGVLTISHPDYSNHNGGTLAFGQDGYLYWSTGDGGSGGDPNNNAQNLASLLGKILRIDVHSGSPYGIPTTNPFYSSTDPNVKKEIWAYGLRNPWRLSFDRLTHDLYIGDVGQSEREEVDFQLKNSAGGQNYGWRVMEGSLCYNPASGCNQSGKLLPVTEYTHTLGCSITGGYVYRGSNFPSLYGYYFYGDYCSGRLFSLYKDAALGWQSVQLLDTSYNISTFGEDEQGELYLADMGTGKLYNIGYQEDSVPPTVTSIMRANPTPASAPSVNFTVTFSESVTGVNPSDFSLTTGSVSGAAISGFSGTGSIYTVTVNTGSGAGTIRLDVVDNDSILDVANNPLGGLGAGNGNFNSGETYTVTDNKITTILSTNTYDGWILESTETSGMGSTKDNVGTTLRLGDDVANKQYRAILSFDTSSIPDSAVITSVMLKFKYAGVIGTVPFGVTHGNLLVDMCKGTFSGFAALQLGDFNVVCSKNAVMAYTGGKVNNWYSKSLGSINFQYINLAGKTQFRLRFSKDDNNDFGADYLKLYSGNALEANRPQLVIEYYVP